MLSICLISLLLAQVAPKPASFTLAGDWDLQVALEGAESQSLHVSPSVVTNVVAEKYSSLPLFNPKAGGWAKGMQLEGVRAQETTNPGLLDKESFSLRAGPGDDAQRFTPGLDFEIDLLWGTVGRLAGGKIEPEQEVFAAYRHAQMRLDAVAIDTSGKIVLRQGKPQAAAPILGELRPGDRHLGSIYLPGAMNKLSPDHLFPILETAYPERAIAKTPSIRRLVQRLESGQPLRILAWGDSVTDGAYLADKATERWQEQFVTRLRARFPKARIELVTQAWGGRNTGSYLAEPPGSPHNYRETVLGVKPDLIISEFVNDAGLKHKQVKERYGKLRADFKKIGAEWIILTPHYVRPDWMGLTKEREIDEDPRPYVAALRKFTARHKIPLADASLRYGRLWRQGIPYNTLMLNAINHPDKRGMQLFADALMALF